jgi:hypothetical protein
MKNLVIEIDEAESKIVLDTSFLKDDELRLDYTLFYEILHSLDKVGIRYLSF